MRTPAQGNLLLRSMREARRVGQDKSSLLDCMDLLFYIDGFSYSIKESGIERVIYILVDKNVCRYCFKDCVILVFYERPPWRIQYGRGRRIVDVPAVVLRQTGF